MYAVSLIVFALGATLVLVIARLASRRTARKPLMPYFCPPEPEPGLPGFPSWDRETGEPIFRCGSIWRDGKEVGHSSCTRLASHFWMSDGEVYCRCDGCYDPGRWMVPNGRDVRREEAVALVAAQDVMLS